MKILFVCTGNTCRSPMLKFIFEDYLRGQKADDIVVDSAGTMEHKKPMAAETKFVLAKNGVPFEENYSKFCSEDLLDGADFIIGLQKSHCEEIRRLYKDKYKTLSVSDVCGFDVPDPYGKGVSAYEETYSILKRAVPLIYAYVCERI